MTGLKILLKVYTLLWPSLKEYRIIKCVGLVGIIAFGIVKPI